MSILVPCPKFCLAFKPVSILVPCPFCLAFKPVSILVPCPKFCLAFKPVSILVRDVSCLEKLSLAKTNHPVPGGLQTSMCLPALTSYH